MTRFVLDCSVAMAWCFADEINDYADAVHEQLETESALAPSLWALEVTNVLLVAERRGRITRTASAEFRDLIGNLPIELVDISLAQAATGIFSLGASNEISAYDAAYLFVAIHRGLPIATLDERLLTAAKACDVALFQS